MQGTEFLKPHWWFLTAAYLTPLHSNAYLHELDRIWVEGDYELRSGFDTNLIGYRDDPPHRLIEARYEASAG